MVDGDLVAGKTDDALDIALGVVTRILKDNDVAALHIADPDGNIIEFAQKLR